MRLKYEDPREDEITYVWRHVLWKINLQTVVDTFALWKAQAYEQEGFEYPFQTYLAWFIQRRLVETLDRLHEVTNNPSDEFIRLESEGKTWIGRFCHLYSIKQF